MVTSHNTRVMARVVRRDTVRHMILLTNGMQLCFGGTRGGKKKFDYFSVKPRTHTQRLSKPRAALRFSRSAATLPLRTQRLVEAHQAFGARVPGRCVLS